MGGRHWRQARTISHASKPLEKPGIGVEVDEDFLKAHPPIEGPGYV